MNQPNQDYNYNNSITFFFLQMGPVLD